MLTVTQNTGARCDRHRRLRRGGAPRQWLHEFYTLSFTPATEADEEALASLLPEGEITDISQLPQTIPSYLIHVVPEIRVDGEVKLTGSAMRLGEDLDFIFQVTDPVYGTKSYPSPVVAGSYLSIAVAGGSVSPKALSDVQARLERTQSTLESQDQALLAGLTRDDILGDMFHAGTLGYFAQYDALARLMGMSQGSHHQLATSVGTYGYVPKVNYLFGFPRSISPGGVEMDLDRVAFATSVDGKDREAAFNFTFQLGALSSALEHAVPEQMFVTEQNPGEAVSAVKALQKASAEGQRIYHITQENQAEALPNIRQNSLTMQEIRSALAVGKEVIVHTDPISVPGWIGAGYVIFDPEVGDGAWKIGGGLNGGGLFWGTILALALLLALSLVSFNPVGIFFGALAFKGFLDRVKSIAHSDLSPEEMYAELNRAAALSIIGALGIRGLSYLGEAGAILTWLLRGWLMAFGVTWYG